MIAKENVWCATCDGYRSALVDCGRQECPYTDSLSTRDEIMAEAVNVADEALGTFTRSMDFGQFRANAVVVIAKALRAAEKRGGQLIESRLKAWLAGQK